MKPLKRLLLVAGCALIATVAWTVLYPILFPEKMKETQAKYDAWVAENLPAKK